ncbi:MAG: hypothetical protein SGILL_010280, partial [Bacillariaceae sp.]
HRMDDFYSIFGIERRVSGMPPPFQDDSLRYNNDSDDDSTFIHSTGGTQRNRKTGKNYPKLSDDSPVTGALNAIAIAKLSDDSPATSASSKKKTKLSASSSGIRSTDTPACRGRQSNRKAAKGAAKGVTSKKAAVESQSFGTPASRKRQSIRKASKDAARKISASESPSTLKRKAATDAGQKSSSSGTKRRKISDSAKKPQSKRQATSPDDRPSKTPRLSTAPQNFLAKLDADARAFGIKIQQTLDQSACDKSIGVSNLVRDFDLIRCKGVSWIDWLERKTQFDELGAETMKSSTMPEMVTPRLQKLSMKQLGNQDDFVNSIQDLSKQPALNSGKPTTCRGYRSSPGAPQPSTLEGAILAPQTTEQNTIPAKLIDFSIQAKIEGEESQIATVTLQEGETLRPESGAMLFMTKGVEMATSLGGGGTFLHIMTGQNVFLTDFTYKNQEDTEDNGQGLVGLGTDFPSKIIWLHLADYHDGSIIAQRGAYLASNLSVNIKMEFTKKFSAGFFGGQGFILQRLSGQGDVLVKAGGTLVEKELDQGEVLRVTSRSIVAFESSVEYDIQMMPGIWLQGMPPDFMIAKIASRVPAGGLGPIIPLGGMGGGSDSGSGGDSDAGGAADGAAGDVAGSGAAGAGVGSGEDMVAASDDAIDADRQATVAASGMSMDDDASG